jgi:hypothetical protein
MIDLKSVRILCVTGTKCEQDIYEILRLLSHRLACLYPLQAFSSYKKAHPMGALFYMPIEYLVDTNERIVYAVSKAELRLVFFK